MSYGQKIIDAIISGAFIKITDVPYDCPQAIMDDGTIQEAQVAPHNHLSVWSSNAEEQLTALVQEFVHDELLTALQRIQEVESERDRMHKDLIEVEKNYEFLRNQLGQDRPSRHGKVYPE